MCSAMRVAVVISTSRMFACPGTACLLSRAAWSTWSADLRGRDPHLVVDALGLGRVDGQTERREDVEIVRLPRMEGFAIHGDIRNWTPAAKSTLPSVHSNACCGVHSALSVGFDNGNTIGRSVFAATPWTTASVKRPCGRADADQDRRLEGLDGLGQVWSGRQVFGVHLLGRG